MGNITISCKCKKCGENVTLCGTDIGKQEYKTRGNKSVWCTYFVCPHCGEKHIVQLDDIVTNGFLIEVTKLMARIAKAQRQGKSTKRYRNRYNKIKVKLEDSRRTLSDKYNGKILLNAFGAEEKIDVFTLDFPEVADAG